jgi:hypothetical protein
VDQTEMFNLLVDELVSSQNIDRLIYFKNQIELDISRIGQDSRLIEKYTVVNQAIELIHKMKPA